MTKAKSIISNPTKNISLVTTAIKQLRLAWLLFKDNRVPTWVKSILPLSMVYVISPLDLIPVFPVVGQLDDLGVILLGLTAFIKLCPPDLVSYYRAEVDGYFGVDQDDENVVDATYKPVDDEKE